MIPSILGGLPTVKMLESKQAKCSAEQAIYSKGEIFMERNSIGGFIAVLRKANGMTQKELAEQLNVSDKTVSRWECGDGDPELSLIPIIAEIFGVTCDELLQGARKSQSEREATADSEEPSAKSDKLIKRLLNSCFSKYKSRSYIAIGISVIGFIAALICNLVFLRAALGALIGMIFFAASIVCQAVFINNAFSSVAESDIAKNDVWKFKQNVIRFAMLSIGLTVTLFGFLLPLLVIDAYMGLAFGSMMLLGSICAAVFLAIYTVLCRVLKAHLLKKEVYKLDEKEERIYLHNSKVERRCCAFFLICAAVTLMIQIPLNSFKYDIFAGGTEFNDYESFIAYMETENPPKFNYAYKETNDEITSYYDERGFLIYESIYQKEILTDINGNVIIEYIARNNEASKISYGDSGDSLLPITVFTSADYDQANAATAILNICFAVVYCAELLTAIIIYRKKRMR